jgi:hypothetical protein
VVAHGFGLDPACGVWVLSRRVGDQVVDDTATLTLLDDSTITVGMPPYPDFPDSAPKVLRYTGRLFERTSTFGYGPPGPLTYLEFVPADAHALGDAPQPPTGVGT